MNYRSIAFSMAAALLGVGCSDTSAPIGDLHVSTTVSADVVRPDAPLTVQISVMNDGSAARTIDASGCNQFVVVSANGDVTAPRAACVLVSAPRTLQPGESFLMTQQWAGDTGTTGHMLPPGEYWIRGQVLAESRLIVGDSVAIRVMQ